MTCPCGRCAVSAVVVMLLHGASAHNNARTPLCFVTAVCLPEVAGFTRSGKRGYRCVGVGLPPLAAATLCLSRWFVSRGGVTALVARPLLAVLQRRQRVFHRRRTECCISRLTTSRRLVRCRRGQTCPATTMVRERWPPNPQVSPSAPLALSLSLSTG